MKEMTEEQGTRMVIGASVPVVWVPEIDRIGRLKRWSRSEVIREAIRQFIGVPVGVAEDGGTKAS